eukprot:848333-Rhodomonas_salina.1
MLTRAKEGIGGWREDLDHTGVVVLDFEHVVVAALHSRVHVPSASRVANADGTPPRPPSMPPSIPPSPPYMSASGISEGDLEDDVHVALMRVQEPHQRLLLPCPPHPPSAHIPTQHSRSSTLRSCLHDGLVFAAAAAAAALAVIPTLPADSCSCCYCC